MTNYFRFIFEWQRAGKNFSSSLPKSNNSVTVTLLELQLPPFTDIEIFHQKMLVNLPHMLLLIFDILLESGPPNRGTVEKWGDCEKQRKKVVPWSYHLCYLELG